MRQSLTTVVNGSYVGIHYRKGENDHVFHQACVSYLIKFYDKERDDTGKPKIGYTIIRTDNYPTQYKCRQNFFHIVTSADNNGSCQFIHLPRNLSSKEPGTPLVSL